MITERYLDLVKSTLVNQVYLELEAQLLMSVLCGAQDRVLNLPDFQKVREDEGTLEALRQAKESGDSVLLEIPLEGRSPGVDYDLRNYTEFSYTMVGRKRLDDLQQCVVDVVDREVPGDLLEAGVWRGGCGILMRAVLLALECTDRRVWLADSFEGLPRSERYEDKDYAMDASVLPILAVGLPEVRANFERFGLLDEQVKFLSGWFDESLQESKTGPLALLRIDCDLYDSTMTVLDNLYPRVSSGGWVIIDDYGMLPPCRKAVDDFRQEQGITAPLHKIDEHAIRWQEPGK